MSDILRAACQAVDTAFARTAVTLLGAVDVGQIGPSERQYDVVAAAHFHGGDLRRIILGCDRPLAEAFGMSPAAQNGPSREVDPARTGLQLFAANLHPAFATRLAAAESTPGFLLHDATSFKVRAQGARNFSLRAATGAGDLHFLIDLAPRTVRRSLFADNGQQIATTVVDSAAGPGIVDRQTIARIMFHLIRSEADVELKVPIARDRIGLLPATVLARGATAGDADTRAADTADDSLVITAAGLDGGISQWSKGSELELVFIVQDKLLQCVCRVAESIRSELDAGITLPALRVEFPERVTYGQRRGAFRIVPQDRLCGTIRRLAAGGANGTTVVSQDVPIEIIDVSCSGLQVALLSNTLLSGFKWGTPVGGRIELPLPYGTAEVTGRVRRLALGPETDGRAAVNLGIELADDTQQDAAALATLRAYVRDHQRRNLEGDLQITACPV